MDGITKRMLRVLLKNSLSSDRRIFGELITFVLEHDLCPFPTEYWPEVLQRKVDISDAC